ncbi:MAG TPA: hypothetical protein VH437_19150 [Terriglobales bacterium]|jgi:hypothetical protein
MKTWTLLFVIAIAISGTAQDKPRVLVQGKGLENVSSNAVAGSDKHWAENMEAAKSFQKGCSGVIVTINQANADYILMKNADSKQNPNRLRSNSQIQVVNRAGEMIGTSATQAVGASKACNLIVADWQAHGHLNAQEVSATPTTRPATVQPAVLKPHEQPKSSPQ